MRKKILFTGGSGLLAVNWALSISENFEVVLGLHQRHISVPGVTSMELNLENEDALAIAVKEIKPDTVIHCAGITNVEKCEADPKLAYDVNVVNTQHIATVCGQESVKLVYISTDHLFSGNRPWVTEENPVTPLNQYAKTKAEAEKKVLATLKAPLIIRTNFYGWGPGYRQSFSDHIINHLRKEHTVSLFDDFYYTPILIEQLAAAVMELLQIDAEGIFNISGNERISKFDFGKKIAAQFQLNSSLIKPIQLSGRKDLAERPSDMSLSGQKISHLLNKTIGDIDEGIRKLYEQEHSGFSKIIQSL